MAQTKLDREEAATSVPALEIVFADGSESTKIPTPLQAIGDIAARIVQKIAVRHGLSLPHAAVVVVELAGISSGRHGEGQKHG